MEQEIKLSSSEFKALASETRTGIIRLLRERNHTLTEISKKLSLAAPTIKQHLGILLNAELVQELDEGRKWKYYTLTRKGKNIFSPESPVNVMIVLGLSVFALAVLMYSFVSFMGSDAIMLNAAIGERPFDAEKAAVPTLGSAAAEDTVQGALPTLQAAPFSPELLALLLAIAAASMIAGYCIAKLKR